MGNEDDNVLFYFGAPFLLQEIMNFKNFLAFEIKSILFWLTRNPPSPHPRRNSKKIARPPKAGYFKESPPHP